MNKEVLVKEYIRQVQHDIYNLYPADEFLSALKDDLENYITQFPECEFDDLVEQFGSPDMVARDFLDSVDTISPKDKAKKKKITKIIWLCLLIVVIILALLCIHAATQRQVMFEDVTTIDYSY